MYPFAIAAGLLAVFFLALTFRSPRPAPILATLLWAAYAIYETYVANGTLCDANCNIRVDLLLFLPVLGIATLLALQNEPRPGAVTTLYVVVLALIAALSAAFGKSVVAGGFAVAALSAAVYGLRAAFARKRAP